MMYSVFLVEDEIVTREGIRNGIPWKSAPYSLAGEAPDGELALSALRDIKPDILITDIKMPFMNGLELSRIVKRDQPWIKIIILSGHDEFEYAKQAISIGVEEYLLKPISSTDMLATLDKVAKQIEEEKDRLTRIEDLRLKVKSSEDVIKEKWLCNLITGQIDTVNAIDTAKSVGIDLIASGYAIMVVEIFAAQTNYAQFAVVKRIIGTIAKNRPDVLPFPQSLEKQIVLIKNAGKDSLDEIAYPLAQAIKFETERNTDCKVAIGIGHSVGHIGEIAQSYADADKALRYMALTGKKNIIGAGDMKWSKAADTFNIGKNHIVEQLRFISLEDTEKIPARYMEIIGGSGPQRSDSSYLSIAYGDIFEAVRGLIEDLQGVPEEVIPEEFLRVDEASVSRERFVSMASEIIRIWAGFRDSNILSKNSLKIREAKKYIEENYWRTDISLNSAASMVNVSPNHFSAIFSQEEEVTFIEYLTSVRIERAKKLLLNSSMKCSDITFEVGYNDPHYFSFIFKKNVGISPRDYRTVRME